MFILRRIFIFSPLLASFITAYPVFEAGFNDETIAKVRSRLLESAHASWERGTAAEALTEFSWPTLSVFDPSAVPPPNQLAGDQFPSDVVKIASETVNAKPQNSLALIGNDGAVGDPASIGVAVLLANWTRPEASDNSYSQAAGQQLDYLLNVAPKSNTGAISHRADEVQLWADFVYMAPPFIAYFGAMQGGDGGSALLQIAYDQCRLYRDNLRDDSGLWRHITLGSWQDSTHWATGNGWAAAGMLRVLETITHSDYASQFVDQQRDLTNWVQEIIDAVWAHQHDSGTLLNTLDDPNSFPDSSSTALLASVTYRLAVITNDFTRLDAASKALHLIETKVDNDGWLQDTVDPYTFNSATKAGDHSPEGQSFVLLLYSAWRDFAKRISGQL